jgi:hypothetical protein
MEFQAVLVGIVELWFVPDQYCEQRLHDAVSRVYDHARSAGQLTTSPLRDLATHVAMQVKEGSHEVMQRWS